MTEHTIAGHGYVIGKLNVRQQFEIATRLGFMTLALGRALEDDHVEGARFIGSIISDDWKALSQVDRDTILNTCLSVVRVQRGDRLHPAFNAQTGLPSFDDVGITMEVMLELVDLVIQDSLGPFLEKCSADRDRRIADLQNPPTDRGTSP